MQVNPTAIRMIALDLDGTLLATGGTVSPRSLAALAAARRAGIEIVIATGRRHSYAMRQLLPVLAAGALAPADILISSNGAVTRSLSAHLFHRAHMPRPTCEALFQHLGDLRNALVVTFDKVSANPSTDPDHNPSQDQRGALVVEELSILHGSIDKWMIANAPSIEHLHPIERCLAGGDLPIQMMLCGSVDRMRRAEAHLLTLPGVTPADLPTDALAPTPADPAAEPTIALHRTEYPDRDLSIVDILPANTSKATALARLLDLRGLAPSHLMCIGDNWNDLPMLALAGHPVLMGNAPADLQAVALTRAWTLTSTNDTDGVALAIEALLHLTPEPEPALTTAS